MDLTASAVDGAFWVIGLALTNKVVTLLGQVALAWFLLPSDMGLANLALATVAFTAVLSVGGLGDVLVQRRRCREEAGQGLWLSVLFSLLMGLAIVGLALAGSAMGKPKIRGLMFVLALSTVLGAPGPVLSAGLKDRLDFKGMAVAQMAGGVVFTLSAVLLAWAGWGAYALIVPTVPRMLVIMGAMALRGGGFSPARPDWAKLRELARPMLALSVSGLFIGLQTQAPVFICGWIMKASSLGLFCWGWSVAGQAVFLLAINLRELLLSSFAKIEGDPSHRAAAAMRAARAMTAMLCLTCGAQALLARPAIGLLVPAQWLPAVPVVMCASLGLAGQGLWISGMAWLNACGRYRLMLEVSVLQTGTAALLTWLGLRFGGFLGASLGCGVAFLAGSVMGVVPMGWEVLARAGRTWWLPVLASGATWALACLVSYGHPVREACGTALFLLVSGWFWWREDDSGLSSVVSGVGRLLRALPLLARGIAK